MWSGVWYKKNTVSTVHGINIHTHTHTYIYDTKLTIQRVNHKLLPITKHT